MDLISFILFVLTIVLVVLMFFLDLQKYKFHILGGIALMGIAVYYYGLVYQVPDVNIIDTLLKAAGNTSQIFRGIFRTSDIMARINANIFFFVSVYLIHVIGFAYTYLLIAAVFFKNFMLQMRFGRYRKGKHYLILGDDETVDYLLHSFEEEHKKDLIGGLLNPPRVVMVYPRHYTKTHEIDADYSYKPALAFYNVDSQPISKIIDVKSTAEIVLISLYQKDEIVLKLVEELTLLTEKNPNIKLNAHILYSQVEKVRLYETFTNRSKHIQFFSYHSLVARQLMMDYPLTRLVPKSFINNDKVTFEAKKIHYHLIGFGDTNQEIYKHLFITNQFPPIVTSGWFGSLGASGVKPVTYNILAPDGQEYMRKFAFETAKDSMFKKKENTYLPSPDIASDSQFITTKLTGTELISRLSELKVRNNDFNCFIVALESDVESLNATLKVREFLTQQRLMKKSKIFVRILNERYKASSALFKDANIIPFGFGNDIYSVHQIMNPDVLQLAKNIHSTEGNPTAWEALDVQERDSLLYEAISIRFKLNLMGLELGKAKKGLSKTEFYRRLDPMMDKSTTEAQLRAKNDADLKVYKDGRKKRALLAQQEQLRWSAYSLIQGWMPMTIEEIKETKEIKDPIDKEDARLTTYEGLFQLHTLLNEQCGYDFQEADQIYTLFHTMDYLYEILKDTPFVVLDPSSLPHDDQPEEPEDEVVVEKPVVTSSIKS